MNATKDKQDKAKILLHFKITHRPRHFNETHLLRLLGQAHSQVFTFGGQNAFLWGKIFVFIICLKQTF